MSDKVKKIKPQKIKELLKKLFGKIKVKEKIYRPVVDGLIETSLRGVDSHGIRLASHYLQSTLLGRINTNPKFKFKKTSATTTIMDADHTYGITSGIIAMEKAIKMAKRSGTGIVVTKNASHFGAAGIFTLIAARKNMIGISSTNVSSLAAPYAGRKAFLGTNAYSFTAPMEGEDPFCLDMATTTINLNKLFMYQRENKKMQTGWAVDKNGRDTTNPREAFILTHFGSYKGYGVALMTEILTSLLSGMAFGPYISHMFPVGKNKLYLGHFFLAIDVKRFVPIATFKKRLRQMADELRSMPPAKGFDKVRVPGDLEKEAYAKRIKEGIPLTEEIVEDFNKVAKEIGVKINF